MSKGYGVFGHVPDNADDDGLLPYEDDDSGVSWGHALRRRNPWKRGDDEDADYDDGRYDIDDTDDTNGGRGIYAGKSGGVGGISGETGGILGSSGAAGSRDVTFGGTDSLSAADAVMPYRFRQGRSVWFDDEDEGHFAGSAKRAEAHAVPILALRNDVESSSSNAVLARARSIARKAATMVSIRYTAKIIEPGMPSLTVFYVAPPAHRVGIVPACNSTSIREKPSAASAHARLTAVAMACAST